MSSSASTPPLPSQLAKFPPEARAAYARYQTTGEASAVDGVVLAILRDFAPTKKAAAHPLADSLRLVEDLGFDSLAVAETVFFIEDLFQVKISNQDLATMHTVGELRAFVISRLSTKTRST